MPQDPLDPLLDRWNQVPETPLHLDSEVWRRIAVGESQEEEPRIGLWDRIELAFRRPSFACAFVVACTLAGLFIAEVRLSRMHAERSAQFARSYIHLIDPLLADSAQGKPAVAQPEESHRS